MERERRILWIPVRRRRRDLRPRAWLRPVWSTRNDFNAQGDIDPGFSRAARLEDETLLSYILHDAQAFKSEVTETPKFGSASRGYNSGESAIKERSSRVESSLSFEERHERAMFIQQMVFSLIFNE